MKAVGLVLFVGFILGSCGTPEDELAGSSSSFPGENQVLLSDLQEELDLSLQAWMQAEDQVVQCMRREGFPFEARSIEIHYPEGALVALSLIDFADTFGYGISFPNAHRGPSLEISGGLSAEADHVDAFNAAYFESPGCGRDHHPPDIEWMIQQEQLGRWGQVDPDIAARVQSAPEFVDAERAWSQCMLEAGFRYGHPSEPFADLDGRFAGGVPETSLAEFQALERRTAGADWRCVAQTIAPVSLDLMDQWS